MSETPRTDAPREITPCPHCGHDGWSRPYGMNPEIYECNKCAGTWHSKSLPNDKGEETTEREQLERELSDAQNILKQCLSIMPVGYVPTHTVENLPEMIGDLAKALAEETTEREKLERELVAKTEAFDRLNESLPKTKRLFTNALAETIINNQLKRIKLLEDELILAIKENL